MDDTVPESTPCRVLVVEDDPTAARSLYFLLTHYGYEVQLASTVRDAIRLLDTRPQIVLLDLMLPDGNGTEVMKELELRSLNARVAVISAVMDAVMLRRVRTFRPEMVLPKPLNFLNLLESLRNDAA